MAAPCGSAVWSPTFRGCPVVGTDSHRAGLGAAGAASLLLPGFHIGKLTYLLKSVSSASVVVKFFWSFTDVCRAGKTSESLDRHIPR